MSRGHWCGSCRSRGQCGHMRLGGTHKKQGPRGVLGIRAWMEAGPGRGRGAACSLASPGQVHPGHWMSSGVSAVAGIWDKAPPQRSKAGFLSQSKAAVT